MNVNSIDLINFRNIKNESLSFSKKINYIIGENAQGKSNLIESIYFSSLLKSYRSNKNSDLINNDEDFFKITLNVNNITSNKIECFLNKKNSKEIKINNKKPTRYQLYDLLSCIIIFNDEISYLKFYPSYRRNFIDRSIFNIENDYLELVRKYEKILKQRNAYLKNNQIKDIWVDQLIKYGSLIINKRISYIKIINDIIRNNKENENYILSYSVSENVNTTDILYDKYLKLKEKEKILGYTLFGPHTDDFNFLIDGQDFRKFSSEGQKLSFLLNLKYSQLTYFENMKKKSPVLIFDDIGKELDLKRKKDIFDKYFNKNCQIFITSTNIDCFTEDSKTFRVEQGHFFDLSQG